ncbi:hypothetical protein [Enterococcus songbeiensis]|uniref:hypothetical protein n=1 Tax=Enterococcus songbeiensis TaxID=2559927 RepID=UPI0010F54898|nr:hypothetical protein [Enterococcus songbeiensis]
MESRAARVNFFRLTPGKKGGINEFREVLKYNFTNFETGKWSKIPTLRINSDVYYIQAMQKRQLEEKFNGESIYYWLITISRVDFDQEIVLADITKTIDERRREIEHEENEGVVVDTQLIFDPFRNILAVYARRGTINTYDLRRFICELVDVRGIQFEIILNKNGYDRIDKLDIVDQISYKVASPDNFKSYKDDTRDEFGDFKFAKKAKGEELYVVLKSSQLSKDSISKKVKDLMTVDNIEIKALKVDGIADGVTDSIDLIKNKLYYSGKIQFEKEINDQAAYGLLNKAFDAHYDYIKTKFKISRIESEEIQNEERTNEAK